MSSTDNQTSNKHDSAAEPALKSRSKAADDYDRPQDEQPATGWQYRAEAHDAGAGDDTRFNASPPQPVSWTATEYAARHKNAAWFLAAILAVVAVTALIYLVTRDIVSAVAFAITGLAFAVFAGRSPRVIQYSVDNQGVYIGQKFYPYVQYRSFSVLVEGTTRSILLIPVKRFGLPLVIHYDEAADEAGIVNVLGGHLPLEERDVPAVDRFMTKIHF